MISPFRKANAIIDTMDGFFDIIERSGYLFNNSIKDFLSGNEEHFQTGLAEIRIAEKKADALLKEIEHSLYKYSLMPELRSDVMRMMQRVDDIVDTMKEVLVQFDVERPNIPDVLIAPFIQLSEISSECASRASAGAKYFFRNSADARPCIQHAIELESKADDLAEKIKRRAFHELHELSLPEKFHIRYFTLHVESVSDIAKSVAYTLNLMLVKRFE